MQRALVPHKCKNMLRRVAHADDSEGAEAGTYKYAAQNGPCAQFLDEFAACAAQNKDEVLGDDVQSYKFGPCQEQWDVFYGCAAYGIRPGN
jgi:hypothetical protein